MDMLRSERGFTIVELMVVVMIVAVLLLISVVTLMGARRAAQDRAAQSLAREALASAKTLFQSGEDYTTANVTSLRAAEPNITFLHGFEASTGPRNVSVATPDASTFVAAVYSLTGTCFYVRDRAVGQTGGTTYGRKTPTGEDPCNADSPPASFSSNW